MKKISVFVTLIALLFLYGFDVDYYPQSQFKPVFMLRSEMEKSIKLENPRPIKNPGKIYLKDNTIFISEKFAGIHVIDNSNPEKPVKKAFIHIDGCVDMAVKDNVLYADNAVDLIALKMKTDLSGIEVTSRNKNVFPELVSPDGYGLSWKQQNARPKDAVLVRWDVK